jgi:Fic family protein
LRVTRSPEAEQNVTSASRSSRHAEVSRSRQAALRYHSVEFLVEHLADCSRVFRGDLQEMLVLAVVGQMQLRAIMVSPNEGSAVGSAASGDPSISASRIADVTGIPRQTVRRKLLGLLERGWVQQLPTGRWQIALDEAGVAHARRDLDPLDTRTIDRVLRLHDVLGRIV